MMDVVTESSGLLMSIGKAVSPTAMAMLNKFGRDKYDRFVALYTNVFSSHIDSTRAKCAHVKTLLHRDDAVNIDDQYVPLKFAKSGASGVSDSDVLSRVKDSGSGIIISGLAGSGKSMFMKWAAMRLIDAIPNTQRIPIFVEIREVKSDDLSLPLDQIVFKKSSSELSNATFDQFHVGLREGAFIVIIDGLDEVSVKYRESILQEVSDFKNRFPKASLICSTRPDRQIESSSSLSVYHVEDMELNQILQVVDNALFDLNKKSGFKEALCNGLYVQHKSFLSNPLLATIMLITFDFSTGVPAKLTLFYSQVYESLFYKHDSSKGVYERERYSNLDIDEFEKVFRTFCFRTYAMTRVSFGEGELLELLRIAIQQNDIETSASYFLKDAKKSLCLMQEDGVYTSFVHRSFQEYFTAKFLHAYGGERYEFLVDEVVTRSFSDNTYLMLCQLNAHDVLRRWAMPRIGRLIAEIDVVLAADDDAVSKFIKSYVSRIMFNPENGVIGNHAWVATSKVEAVHAINLALEIAGVAHSIVGLRGNVYPNGEISQASETILQRADWEEEEDDRGDIVETGNKEMSVMHLNKDAISGSGIRNAILNLREELVTGRGEIEKKINIADNFAAEVNVIFGQNRV